MRNEQSQAYLLPSPTLTQVSSVHMVGVGRKKMGVSHSIYV